MVRPIIEYTSPVWSPHLVKDIAALEKVQSRASRIEMKCHMKIAARILNGQP